MNQALYAHMNNKRKRKKNKKNGEHFTTILGGGSWRFVRASG
jgi:hypothetical protein